MNTRNNRRQFLLAGGSLALTSALPARAAAPVTLRVGDVQANSAYDRGLQALAKDVEGRTKGRVKLQVLTGTQLGNELDMVKQVRAGTLDMCQVGVSGYDKFQMLYVPYLFGRDKMMAFTRSEIGESWRASLVKDWNVQLLEYVYFGPRHMTAKKLIAKPEDLKGVKIRVPQLPALVDAFKAWNANVVAMAVGELYIGLQTGNLDAQENPLNFIISNSLFEVQSDLMMSAHAQAPRFLMIGANSMKRLSPEDQKHLQAAAKDMAASVEKTLRAEDEQYLATAKSKGMKIHEINVAPFVAVVKDIGREQANKVWGPGVLDKIRSQFGPV
jgi:tripartite ATP-independent transporter DctP family solute receptor